MRHPTSGAVVVCEENCTGTRYFTHEVAEDNKSVEEAIDAVFMNELENDFRSEDDNEYDA